uniref:ING domain-containing protein n=1 Tax=Strongyloides papillosus TaxID=174720 RepID=A0A0N5C7Y3_STREA
MVFRLDCQIVDKLDEAFLESLLVIEDKENRSCKTSFTECSKEFLELVNDGATARDRIMEKYIELVNAIKDYEKITDTFSKKVSESQTRNNDAENTIKLDSDRNVEESLLEETVENALNQQDSHYSEHFGIYDSKDDGEYILSSLSIPKPPELNFNYY